MEKLKKLIGACKADIDININNHKSSYETVEQYFQFPTRKDDVEDINIDVLEKMKELDIIIELQFYPNTPIGSYKIYHYDVEKAIDEALEILKIT
jgi:hypothetical protein